MVATAQRFQERNPQVEISWSKRSLQEFADKPISELANRFDLLVIDHPWAGFAASSGVLAPLDECLSAEFLVNQAHHSVGQSHASYQFDGRQWALAVDAACPVSAYRPDLLAKANATLPQTFDEVIDLGRRGLVCCPSIPLDTYGNFLNLLTAGGARIFPNDDHVADRQEAIAALDRLKQLTDVIPTQFFELNPIRTLEVMSQQDEFAYCPYTYGYTNYARPGYAAKLLRFADVVGTVAGQPGATMLGGTGLAISANCTHMDVAVEYAEFVASPAIQQGLYFQAGGQPGHRSAWLNEDLNAACSNFFADTLGCVDRAFVRPRHAGYLEFQDRAGEVIHAFLQDSGGAESAADEINRLYRESTTMEVR